MKHFKLLFLLAFVACFMGARADELTVADSTATSTYVPITGNYFDTEGTFSQMIYSKALLEDMADADINSVTFYPNAVIPEKLAGVVLEISFFETDQDEMSRPSYSYQPFDSENFVSGGTYTIVGNEEVLKFDLTTPFSYSGDKNLVIQLKVVTKGTYSSITFLGKNQSNTVSYYKYSSTASGTTFLPKTTFDYQGEVFENDAKVSPTELDFGSIEEKTEATMSVTLKNKGTNAFTPVLSTLLAPFSTTWTPTELAAGESVEIPVTFAPEGPGEYSTNLTIDCGLAGTFNVALSGIAFEHVDEVTVADGTTTNSYFPITGNYIDEVGTFSQMIYPKDLVAGLADTEITSVKFFANAAFGTSVANAVLEISFCETDQEEISGSSYSATAISTDLFTACGTYTFNAEDNEINFVLDTPFEYTGDKNLAVMVKVTTKSGYKGISFLGQNQSKNGSYYYTSRSSGRSTFLPKTIFAYNKEVKEYAAKVNPSELAFGKLETGEESVLNVTVENKGANAFTPALSGLEAPFSTTWTPAELATGEIATIPVKFAPTEAGTFSNTLTVNCGEAGSFEIALSGRAIEPGSELTLCEGTDLNQYIPVYGTYYDNVGTQSQFIYPESMLTALKGREITSVKFYHNGNLPIYNGKLQLSLKETEQSIFERETSIAKPNEVTDMTIVATAVPSTTSSELEFVFDQPFAYNGGNLAFETLVIEKNNYATTKFYGVNQTIDCAFNAYATSSNIYKFLPQVTFESKQATVPVGEDITLAQLLASGEEGNAYTLTDNLAVAAIAENAPTAYLTDGENWIRVDLNVIGLSKAENTALLQSIDLTKALESGAITGLFSNREVAPTLTVKAVADELVGETGAPSFEIKDLDLTADLRANMPVPCQVVNVLGYYNDGALTAYSGLNGDPGQTIELVSDLIEPFDFVTASRYNVRMAIELKQPWEADQTSGAPRRAKTTDGTAYQNLKGQIISAQSDITTGVTDINAKANAVSVKYVNAAGMVSNRPFDGMNIVVTTNADGSVSVSKVMK